MRHLLLLAFAFILVMCAAPTTPQLGQVLFYVDTDAPVPPGGGHAAGLSDPTPLFDTLRIELFEPGKSTPCAGCIREFDVDKEKFTNGGYGAQRVSVGIPTREGVTNYRLRVSLFLHEWLVPCISLTDDQQASFEECSLDPNAFVPHPLATISSTVSLPVTKKGVTTEVYTLLTMDTLGVPSGSLDQPLLVGSPSVQLGKPPPSRASTWPGSARHGCSTKARPGEACVPSGAFWAGNPRALAFTGSVQANVAAKAFPTPRLVILSPFFMKTTEVTVGECRADPTCAAGANQGAYANICTNYTGPFNWQYPTSVALNCVAETTRDDFCAAWGKKGTVPTAAQLEYVGRGLNGSTFVWGDDLPNCDDAMWGRYAYNELGPCYNPKLGYGQRNFGPFPIGLGKRDRLLTSPDAEPIVDIAGNLAEYTRDTPNTSCKCVWPPGVLTDPVCDDPSNFTRAFVGGLWSSSAIGMAIGEFGCYQDPSKPAGTYLSADVGFRCVRPDN
jgi:formylglycine-generating enzyme required for sulfatase activity